MDVLIVGCGLTGSVIARELANNNKKVIILEKRDHIGGNMYDYVDSYGILVQKYGPHTFHTKEKDLYDYILKYGEWESYQLTCMAEIDGKVTPTPFNFQTIDDFYCKEDAKDLKARIKQEFGNKETATVLEVLRCKDEKIRKYAEFLFDKDYKLYTAKQWGVSVNEIDPSILSRVPLRFSYEVGYFDRNEYQIMPKKSFTYFFERLLDHENIDIQLNVNALDRIKIDGNQILIDGKNKNIPLVYTGALDELFSFTYGKLPYRSLRFEWQYEDIDSKQDAPVVAYPQAEGYTRITEYKKLPVQYVRGTTYAIEYPLHYNSNTEEDLEPYYPVLQEDSNKMYALYKKEADKISNLFYAGRLADFKYYNMDQALKRALEVYDKLKLLA